MGFPLHKGALTASSPAIGITPAFDLESGGTFDPWADDVQIYPTIVEDGIVYVDARPAWRPRGARQGTALGRSGAESQSGRRQERPRVARGRCPAGRDPGDRRSLRRDLPARRLGGRFDDSHRDGQRSTELHPEDQALALYHGLVNVASDCAGQPPRFALDPLPTRDVPLGAERLQGGSVASSTSATPTAPSARS